MVVCHLPYGPTAYFGIFNTVLRHDIGQKKEVGTISEAYPHLIFDHFTSQLGQRLSNVLKHLFPVPKDESKRVVTFANRNDFISFRHHVYSAPRGVKSVELTEVRTQRCRFACVYKSPACTSFLSTVPHLVVCCVRLCSFLS